jgi:DNA primase
MDQVQEIKNRLSIVEVVSSYVELKQSGRNFKGLCPFHNDHDPSFIVSPDKEFCWCFVCNKGGDIFSFVQEIENVEFPQALEILAEKAGVEIKKQSPEKLKQKNDLKSILEAACQKFEHNYQINQKVQKAVEERQISVETLEQFRIGFSWQGERELEKFLLNEGYSHKQLIESGLSVPIDSQGAQTRDKFRSRIMFPLFSASGEVVAFSGRAFGDFEPKFLNSPDTKVFKKSEVLYGLNFAKEAIRQEDLALIVEGQFDLLALVDKGYKNTVAVSGTALSKSHLSQIKRFTKNIALAFDGDKAGKEATKRAIELIIENDLVGFVIKLPEGLDPDQLLRENPEVFKELKEQAVDGVYYYFQLACEQKDLTDVNDQGQVINELLPFLNKFNSNYQQDYYLVKLSEILGVNINSLRADFQRWKKNKGKLKRQHLKKDNERSIDEQKSLKIKPIQYLIGMILAFPELLPVASENLVSNIFPECQEKNLFEKLKNSHNSLEKKSPEQIIFADFSEEDRQNWKLITLFTEEKTENIPESLRVKEFKKLVAQINRLNFQQTQSYLISKMRKTPSGSTEERDLFRQLNQLANLAKNF